MNLTLFLETGPEVYKWHGFDDRIGRLECKTYNYRIWVTIQKSLFYVKKTRGTVARKILGVERN